MGKYNFLKTMNDSWVGLAYKLYLFTAVNPTHHKPNTHTKFETRN